MSTNFFALARKEARQFIGTTADGFPVFSKKGASHVANHADVLPYLPEILARVSTTQLAGRDLIETVELDEVCGVSTCVETSPADKIVYRRRKGRKECTRFVVGRQGTPVNTAVVILFRNDDGLFALMTCYFGNRAPAHPNSPSGRKDKGTWQTAKEFWENHALILDDDVEGDECAPEEFFGVEPT